MINYTIEYKTKSAEGRSGRVISTSAAREAGYDGSRTFWSVDTISIRHGYENMGVAGYTTATFWMSQNYKKIEDGR